MARALLDAATPIFFLFERLRRRDAFLAKVGEPKALVRVVHNGVSAGEFEPVATDPQASDLLFVGELRLLKGVDLLIAAIALLAQQGTKISLTIVGEASSIARPSKPPRCKSQGLADLVRFVGGAKPAPPLHARTIAAVPVPSRAESPLPLPSCWRRRCGLSDAAWA